MWTGLNCLSFQKEISQQINITICWAKKDTLSIKENFRDNIDSLIIFVQVIFEAYQGSANQQDIALDDIFLEEGACPMSSESLNIHQFIKILKSSVCLERSNFQKSNCRDITTFFCQLLVPTWLLGFSQEYFSGVFLPHLQTETFLLASLHWVLG